MVLLTNACAMIKPNCLLVEYWHITATRMIYFWRVLFEVKLGSDLNNWIGLVHTEIRMFSLLLYRYDARSAIKMKTNLKLTDSDPFSRSKLVWKYYSSRVWILFCCALSFSNVIFKHCVVSQGLLLYMKIFAFITIYIKFYWRKSVNYFRWRSIPDHLFFFNCAR